MRMKRIHSFFYEFCAGDKGRRRRNRNISQKMVVTLSAAIITLLSFSKWTGTCCHWKHAEDIRGKTAIIPRRGFCNSITHNQSRMIGMRRRASERSRSLGRIYSPFWFFEIAPNYLPTLFHLSTSAHRIIVHNRVNKDITINYVSQTLKWVAPNDCWRRRIGEGELG